MQSAVFLFDEGSLGELQVDADIDTVPVVHIHLETVALFAPVIERADIRLVLPEPCGHRHENQVRVAHKVTHDYIQRVNFLVRQ